jgi:D-alanine-D-alanine ligase
MVASNDKLPVGFPSNLLIWVLVPQVHTDDPNIDYYYDFSQSIDEYTRVFGSWECAWKWQPVTMEDYEPILRSLRSNSEGYQPLVLNLCDGDEYNGSPGISVIRLLDELGLPYTGSDLRFYEATTSKIFMKELFDQAGVPTPSWEKVGIDHLPVNGIFERLGKPLIVKPAISAGSMGIGVRNVVEGKGELEALIHTLEAQYRGWALTTGGILAEQFIAGPEFTTLIVGSWDQPTHCTIYPPVERVFHPALPEKERFLSFDRLWEIYETESPIGDYEDFYQYALPQSAFIKLIQEVSFWAYQAVKGVGYGRVDLRMDSSGQLKVLEVNAQCGLSEDEDYTSIGAILRLSGLTYASLIEAIARDGLRRAGAVGFPDTGSPGDSGDVARPTNSGDEVRPTNSGDVARPTNSGDEVHPAGSSS